ncbi:hypothetical protein BGX27_002284, partial [Mortierella sp. AM989]
MVKATVLMLTFCVSVAFAGPFFHRVNIQNNAGTKLYQFRALSSERLCECVKNTQTGSIQGLAGGDIKLFQSSDCTGNFQKLGSNSKLVNTQWGESDEADIEDDDVPHSPFRERYNRLLMQTPKHNRPYRQEEPWSQDGSNAITRRTAKDGTMYTKDMQHNDPLKEIVGGSRKVQESSYVQSLRRPSTLNGDVTANYGSPVGRSLQQRH